MFKEFFYHKMHSVRLRSALEVAKTRPAQKSDNPFPNIIIDNFFPEDFYQSLVKEFQSVLNRGLSEKTNIHQFSRFPHYDAYSFTPQPLGGTPSDIFYTPAWLDFICSFFPNVNRSADTNAVFHYHKVGSQNGWPHCDFSWGAFKNDPLSNGVNAWYHQGPHTTDPPAEPGFFHSIRSVAVLYYINNKPWHEGDGGETGLYAGKDLGSLVTKVAPINNRLLLFEVSPDSYHSFLSNVANERNSVVQWAFEKPEDSFKKYDREKIGSWSKHKESASHRQ